MSDKKHYAEGTPPNTGTSEPPQWADHMPPPGYYPYPPHMMHPYYYPAPYGYPPVMPEQQNGSNPQAQPLHGYPPQGHPIYGYPPPGYGAHGQIPPHGAYNAPGSYPPPENGEPQNTQGNIDPLFEQAQAMLEDALGEEAGIFKELLGATGMYDKEFWKGAAVGAAAALLLSNESVRKGIKNAVSGAGSALKSGGENVKNATVNTASTVQQNVNAGGEIFRDTYVAGKEGFKESVARHQEKSEQSSEDPDDELISTTDTSKENNV